jgi:hypothetical protein
MPKDSLQQTWLKALSSIVTSAQTDSTGSVWVGDMSGKLTKFSPEGVASESVQFDNPIYSVSVDGKTNDVYVGDAANNIYKVSQTGHIKWGKNIGKGTTSKVPLVSTINGNEPDNIGNIDLSNTYYSQKQLDDMLSPLGRTKTVNGKVPDESGNVVIDLSNMYKYLGVLKDINAANNATDTGWYVIHDSSGSNSTLLVYSDTSNTTQVLIGNNGKLSTRSKNGTSFGQWNTLTDNIRSINGIKPDESGNIALDLTGNIKSVNGIKPDKTGDIQLGAGSANSIKSVNTTLKPDKAGNVDVPTFAPNLLKGTTNKKQTIPVSGTIQNINLWQSEAISSTAGINSLGKSKIPSNSVGEPIVVDTPVTAGNKYVYSITAWTVFTTIADTGSHYSLWRKPTATICAEFKNSAGSVLDTKYTEKHVFDSNVLLDKYTFTGYFKAPTDAVSVTFYYNGFQETAQNLVVGEANSAIAYARHTNSQDQLIDLPTMTLSSQLPAKQRLLIKLQANVTNYTKGSVFTLKTQGLVENLDFILDKSKLDDEHKLVQPAIIDTDNLVIGNGFYTWTYVVDSDDLVGADIGTITPVTNVIGNVEYTIKISKWDAGEPRPDMEWISAPKVDGTYNDSAYNEINFWTARLHDQTSVNIVELGKYNIGNDYIALDDTAGKYSASAHIDFSNSDGYCKLVIQQLDSAGTVLDEATSNLIPVFNKDDTGTLISDKTGILTTNSIKNSKPTSTDVIKVFLYIYGQTAAISSSQVKLAQWKNDDTTPPDMTWLPNVEDVMAGIQQISINGGTPVTPDKNGLINLLLSGLEHPDYTITTSPFDLDGLAKTGIYRLEGVNLVTTKNSTALASVPSSVIKSAKGFLIQKHYSDYYNMQILILYDVPNYTDITWAFRCIGLNLISYNDTFKTIVTDRTLNTALALYLRPYAKSVNGNTPDTNGNVTIKIPDDYIKTVNGKTPDTNGNVNLDTGGVKTVNGKNGDVTIPAFAPNLIKNTSNTNVLIPSNTATDIYHLTTESNTKYTVSAIIDYSSTSTDNILGGSLQVNNGGSIVESDLALRGTVKRVSVTFTTPANCLWVTILVKSTTQFNGYYRELKASRWQDANTPPDMTWLPNTDDNTSAINDLKNQISASTNGLLKTWTGTLTQYQALPTHDKMTMYLIISDYKVVVK